VSQRGHGANQPQHAPVVEVVDANEETLANEIVDDGAQGARVERGERRQRESRAYRAALHAVQVRQAAIERRPDPGDRRRHLEAVHSGHGSSQFSFPN